MMKHGDTLHYARGNEASAASQKRVVGGLAPKAEEKRDGAT